MTTQSDRQGGDGLDITPEMAVAGRKALAVVADRMEEAKLLATSSIDFWQRVGHEPANEIYRAMLAAAPTRDAAEGADSAVLLRGWAKAYRDTPEHRFPSDPNAEFFPVDLECAADLLSAPPKPAPDAMRSLIALVLPVLDAAAAGKSVQLAATDVARELRALSRQAPHSSREGGR